MYVYCSLLLSFTVHYKINIPLVTFRSICDVTNVFFLIDEQTDNAPVDLVIERCEMAMDAILYPHKPRPEGESIIGEATRQ